MRTRVGPLLGQTTIVLGATVLIVLAWAGSLSVITAQRQQAEVQVEAAVDAQAQAFEQQISRQIAALDQILRLLRHAQEAAPSDFHLKAWRAQTTLLNEVSGTLFLTDEDGTVRDASPPAPVAPAAGAPAAATTGSPGGPQLGSPVASPDGSSVDLPTGSPANPLVAPAADPTINPAIGANIARTAMFRALAGQTDNADRMFLGPTTLDPLAPGWHMDFALPLRHPDGTFAGTIGLTYQAATLASLFQAADLGQDDMIAVIGTGDARLRAEVGPVPIAPDDDIRGSAMLQAMQEVPPRPWIGPSAPDGIERVHAFRHVPGLDLDLVVGIARDAALAPAATWARVAWVFAGWITAMILLMTVLLLRAVNQSRARAEALEKEHSRLAASTAALETAKARADAKAAQLNGTLAGMTDGVAMVDTSHCLVEWNDLFSTISGVPPELLRVGVSMEELIRAQAEAGEFGPVDVEAEVARRVRLLHSGRLAETTERTRPDGRIIELRRNHLPDGGMVTLYTDITAHKQVENALRLARTAAEEAAAAKSRFVAIVSHEIRTPLNALLNSLLLLADGAMIPPQRALVDLARQSGDALLDLINDILDMSRLEAGQLTLRRSVFALRPLLTGVLEMMRPLAARRGIALHLALGENTPPLLFNDPVRLRQVLLNLLGNAAKYAAPGGVVLTAEILEGELPESEMRENYDLASEHRESVRPQTLRLAVRDRGPAIAEAERRRLFQPFSQLDQPGAQVQPGSGLGLAICQLLATLMNGAVGCTTIELSSMGQPSRGGNEFWLSLPIGTLPLDAVVPADRPQAMLPTLPHTRILLVEDVVASRIVVARLLRRAGHLVDTAASGEAAIAAVAHLPYDVVLMDVHLPGMSGSDTARQIRILSGAAGAVPIIALTATTSVEEVAQCRAAGMNGLVTKPATLLELLAAIVRHAWPGRPMHAADRAAMVTNMASDLPHALNPQPAPDPHGAPDLPPRDSASAGASASAGNSPPAGDLAIDDGPPRDPDRPGAGGLPHSPDLPGTPNLQVLATARLDELRRHLAPTVLGALVEECLLDLHRRLPALRDALGSGDSEAVLQVAHAMAGAAGGYAMALLEARLHAIVQATSQRNLPAAAALAEDLEEDLAQAAKALRSALLIEAV